MSKRIKTRRRLRAVAVAPRTVVTSLCALLAAGLSLQNAAGFVLAERAPALAVGLSPASGLANAAQAMSLLLSPNGATLLAQAEQLSRKALIHEPLTSVAARNLGFVAIGRQQELVARDWMMLGNAMSRRDMLVQAWLYTQGTANGRAVEAIEAADLILRQSSDSWEAMMPVLAGNLQSPAYVQPLADALARRPVWRGPFLSKAGSNLQNSKNFWQLLAKLKQAGATPTTAETATYFGSQADIADPLILWSQWTAMVPTSLGKLLIRDSAMDGIDAPPPFIWRLNPAEGIISEFSASPDGVGSALYLSYEDKKIVNFGQQKLVLRPGTYRLAAKSLLESAEEGSQAFVAIKCGLNSAGGHILKLPFSMVGEGWTSVRGEFSIPVDCPAQYIWIGAESNLGAGGSSLWVDNVAITAL